MEKEDLGPGSVVWVKFRSWYPAEILGVDQLGVKERALPLGQDTVYVKRFGIGDIRLAKIKCLDQLGEDAVDAARARWWRTSWPWLGSEGKMNVSKMISTNLGFRYLPGNLCCSKNYKS